MRLSDLLAETEILRISGDTGMEISDIVYDTRKEIVPGCIFVALSGARFDGHDYLEEAVKKGAAAVVVEKEEKAAFLSERNRRAGRT